MERRALSVSAAYSAALEDFQVLLESQIAAAAIFDLVATRGLSVQ